VLWEVPRAAADGAPGEVSIGIVDDDEEELEDDEDEEDEKSEDAPEELLEESEDVAYDELLDDIEGGCGEGPRCGGGRVTAAAVTARNACGAPAGEDDNGVIVEPGTGRVRSGAPVVGRGLTVVCPRTPPAPVGAR